MTKKTIGVDSVRSAKTGEFITKNYAKKYPATTVVSAIRRPVQNNKK